MTTTGSGSIEYDWSEIDEALRFFLQNARAISDIADPQINDELSKLTISAASLYVVTFDGVHHRVEPSLQVIALMSLIKRRLSH